jgi:tetratricopeptide (TPR) repeat protein
MKLLTFPSLHRRFVWCALLLVATVAAYWPLFHNGFVDLDDQAYITGNVHIRTGVTWDTVKWASTTYYASNWHPLTWVSHAVDVSLFYLNPVGHHAVSLLLHAINGILLFLLLYQATGREWASLFVAAAFALHPVNVESVAWAAERKSTLSMLFLLLTMILYTAYAKKRSPLRYVAMSLSYAFGLMAKPQIITLPFLLLLWDYWPLRRFSATGSGDSSSGGSERRPGWLVLIAEKIPLFALSGVSALLTMRAQSAGGAVQVASTVGHTVAAFSLSVRLKNAIVAYGRYLVDLIWPTGLAAMYPHPGNATKTASVIVSGVALLLITAAALAAGKRRGYLASGWLWFLGAMVPMIGIVQVGSQAHADRYAYLPYIGLFIATAWAFEEVISRRPGWRAAGVAVAAAAALALGAATFRQAEYWRDPETLWTHTLAVTKGNFFAHDALAGYLTRHGRMAEGCIHSEKSLEIFPEDVIAQESLGVCYQAKGEPDKAILQYQSVLRMAGDGGIRTTAYANLGSIYRQRGEYRLAKENFDSALQLNPKLPIALVGEGLLAQKGWDFSRASEQYARAISVEPTSIGYLLLARALEQCGRSAEAKTAYAAAQRISTNIPADQKAVDDLLAN